MPLLTMFDTPGSLRDFPAGSSFYKVWSDIVSNLIGSTPVTGPGGVGAFYNPTKVPEVRPAGERLLVWMGFPRRLLIGNRDQRQTAFQNGDVRGNSLPGLRTQAEYFEWFVTRVGNKIKKVTFTTETEAYWRAMYDFDPARVLALYKDLVSPAVVAADLGAGTPGSYIPMNRWNTADGIVHYIVNSPPNTLEAAIGLAKGSINFATPHVRDNYELTMTDFTSADPRVQTDINMLARKGLYITGREPIGLYMVAWDDTGWTKPDTSPVGNYWKVVRGVPGRALRLEYEVPVTEGFFVSDIRIGGRTIKYGGHLAEHITVMIGGLAGTPA